MSGICAQKVGDPSRDGRNEAKPAAATYCNSNVSSSNLCRTGKHRRHCAVPGHELCHCTRAQVLEPPRCSGEHGAVPREVYEQRDQIQNGHLQTFQKRTQELYLIESNPRLNREKHQRLRRLCGPLSAVPQESCNLVHAPPRPLKMHGMLRSGWLWYSSIRHTSYCPCFC